MNDKDFICIHKDLIEKMLKPEYVEHVLKVIKDSEKVSFTPPKPSFLRRIKNKLFGCSIKYDGQWYGYKGRK